MDLLQQPGGSQGRPTAFLSFRVDARGRNTRRLCPRLYLGTLTIVACRRIVESRAMRITESRGIPTVLFTLPEVFRILTLKSWW